MFCLSQHITLIPKTPLSQVSSICFCAVKSIMLPVPTVFHYFKHPVQTFFIHLHLFTSVDIYAWLQSYHNLFPMLYFSIAATVFPYSPSHSYPAHTQHKFLFRKEKNCFRQVELAMLWGACDTEWQVTAYSQLLSTVWKKWSVMWSEKMEPLRKERQKASTQLLPSLSPHHPQLPFGTAALIVQQSECRQNLNFLICPKRKSYRRTQCVW